MIAPTPVTLEGHGVRLEPLAPAHRDGLAAAAADGRLWELWLTFVPEPGQAEASVRDSVMYSILAAEWPDVKRHLSMRLARHGHAPG